MKLLLVLIVLIGAEASAPFTASDIPSLILNEGVSVAIVTLFIIGQWTGRIVFVDKDRRDQLDRIEQAIKRIEQEVRK